MYHIYVYICIYDIYTYISYICIYIYIYNFFDNGFTTEIIMLNKYFVESKLKSLKWIERLPFNAFVINEIKNATRREYI